MNVLGNNVFDKPVGTRHIAAQKKTSYPKKSYRLMVTGKGSKDNTKLLLHFWFADNFPSK